MYNKVFVLYDVLHCHTSLAINSVVTYEYLTLQKGWIISQYVKGVDHIFLIQASTLISRFLSSNDTHP